MNDERLIVFVKAPRPGTVKTRLGLGTEAECAAYQQLVQVVLATISDFHNVELRFAPADAEEEIRPWLRPGWATAPQSEGDLGSRMRGAFADAFERGAKRVVIIGSDCPYLAAKDVEHAWAELKTSDLVVGPANDGGYWLIGLRANQPALFKDIEWSSSTVFTDTIGRAKALGLKIALLRELSDVDTRDDWERFSASEALSMKPLRSQGAD